MSQNKYNFKFNPPELTSEQINKHKDFGALLAKFEAAEATKPKLQVVHKRNWRRTLTYISSVGAAAMIALLLYFNTSSPDIEQIVADKLAAMPYVNPPMMEMQKEFATFTLDGSEGGVYEYESGSKVTVPANAFVDESGALVTGEVELKYREFHDAVDFFLGGISMDYDSASIQNHLVSAGMIEVKAYKNGEPVELSEDKELDIELVSTIDYHPDYKFNVYRLNIDNRNWKYEGIDNIEPILTGDLKAKMDTYLESQSDDLAEEVELNTVIQEIKTIQEQQEVELQALVSTNVTTIAEPLKPKKAREGDMSTEFKPENLESLAPEIAQLQEKYGELIWVTNKNFERQMEIAVSVEWESMTSIKVPNSDEFEITLKSSEGGELKLNLRPVLMGNNYEKAMADYEVQMQAYNEQTKGQEGLLEEKKAEITQRYEGQLLVLEAKKQTLEEKITLERQKGYNNLLTEMVANQKVINRFKVTRTGVWNCSRIIPPAVQSVEAKFEDDVKQPMEYLRCYLVNKKQNTVVQFLTTGDKAVPFRYTDTNNVMWAVDKDGKFLIVTSDDFKKISDETETYTFNFAKVDKSISTEADLREVLDL
jgi:hypothetical protein